MRDRARPDRDPPEHYGDHDERGRQDGEIGDESNQRRADEQPRVGDRGDRRERNPGRYARNSSGRAEQHGDDVGRAEADRREAGERGRRVGNPRDAEKAGRAEEAAESQDSSGTSRWVRRSPVRRPAIIVTENTA